MQILKNERLRIIRLMLDFCETICFSWKNQVHLLGFALNALSKNCHKTDLLAKFHGIKLGHTGHQTHKATVHFSELNISPKYLLEMYSLSGHPRCRGVYFFIRLGEMLRLWWICSAMDALQWMRDQTADKNITIIHTTPVHQLTSWEEKAMFVHSSLCFFTLNFFLVMSSIHNIALSNEKVVLSDSGEKYAQINYWLQMKAVQNISK